MHAYEFKSWGWSQPLQLYILPDFGWQLVAITKGTDFYETTQKFLLSDIWFRSLYLC